MQVKWLKKAVINLDQEASYIAEADPDAARRTVKRILTAIANLQENPALGRSGRVVGTRELVVPNTRYLIPYRVNTEQNQIVILRIFHTSRKTPERW